MTLRSMLVTTPFLAAVLGLLGGCGSRGAKPEGADTSPPGAGAIAPSSAGGSSDGNTKSTLAPAATVRGVALPDFATLAERVVPAVVSIETERHVKVGGGRGAPGRSGGPTLGPFDFFRFYGEEMPQQYENRGLGSGFIIEENGLILTNSHVIEKADVIEVTLGLTGGGEKKLKARVVGEATEYDVALIKTEEDARGVAVPLGDSDTIRIGDWVMAVGNPFGLSHSVSVGIISAKERRELAPSGRRGLYNFLQTDASINPGNSGGPLVNTQGAVIGINSAINAQGQGIGFAIPINMVKAMLPDLKKGGRFVRSWIGIKIQALSPELAQSYGYDGTQGVLVADVVKDGPGAKAGLHEGDIILEFDGHKLNRSSDLPLYASMAGVGKKVPLVIWRERGTEKLTVELQAFPEDEGESALDAGAASQDEGEPIGIGVIDLTPELRERLNVEAPQGVFVESVESGSAAAKAGLLRGDIIVSINGQDVSAARDAMKIIRASETGGLLRLRIERDRTRLYVALRRP